ncbi:SDR family oxidoreductase [Lichenicola sp.]|uniref:SDR family oxidoreductase n=1 Tax=Lichenicola sp. TaxID=2804529 RepID=UPI003AFFEC2A
MPHDAIGSARFIPATGGPGPVHVVGASGRSGQALVRALSAGGVTVVPVVRSAARWAATGIALTPRLADLEQHDDALALALAGAGRIASTVHARYVGRILQAAPADAGFVFLGSTRKFTRWPDDHGNGVLAGERAFLSSGRHGVMLHPTMIYGAEGEDNVQRLAALLKRLPMVPLPGGGRALVQPIHQSDVTASVLAALARLWNGPHSLVIAGPDVVAYRQFAAAVALAAGLPPRPVLRVPAWPLMLGALLARPIPGLPSIGPAEIRRLMEDKAFDIAPMRTELGVAPISLAEGLARTFAR